MHYPTKMYPAKMLCAIALMGVSGCSSAPDADPELRGDPIWPGPPITATSTADGGMELLIIAPTANHDLTYDGATRSGDTADVTMTFVTPGQAITAQVLTPVRAEVPATDLGEATRVRFWIATVPRDEPTATAEPSLSLVQRRTP